jgi:hypothetical protein
MPGMVGCIHACNPDARLDSVQDEGQDEHGPRHDADEEHEEHFPVRDEGRHYWNVHHSFCARNVLLTAALDERCQLFERDSQH